MPTQVNVAFKTLDGLTLRGCLYLAGQRGPAVIMTPGFNSITIALAQVAEYISQAGFNVLVYDSRSIGASDGQPRNEINPARNVEDYHDALTYLKTHEQVDPAQIAYWGYSYSGMIALCAAALDKRAKAVVAIAPMTIWDCLRQEQVLQDAMRDREARLRGSTPATLPMLTENNENPAGIGITSDGTVTRAGLMKAASMFPEFVPQTTISSYYHITKFNPFKLMPSVSPTPVLLVIAEKDKVSPPHLQTTLVYDSLGEPKQLLRVVSKGHMNILRGADCHSVFDAQVKFLFEAFGVQSTSLSSDMGTEKSRL